MADTDAAAAGGKPADKGADKTVEQRTREHVERLLARPPATSAGSVAVGGHVLEYDVSAGFLPVGAPGLDGASGAPEAAVLTTAYLLKGAEAASRPVCFAFNGGPGSASIWLHLGALGPKRVVVPDDGSTPRPPFPLEDNPHTWFGHFDLVFIDPPHTGWSATASEAARKRLLSVDGDIAGFADVIRGWLTRHRRWSSPVYLAGESYGTTRGAGIADALQTIGVGLAGVVLVSCAMDIQTLDFDGVNHLPYALFLPGFANVAQYHGLLKGPIGHSSQAAREAAEAFVQEEYVAALHAGHRLSEKTRSRVAGRIAELTGLPRSLVEEKNLRLGDVDFFFEAMRDRGLQVGRLDARVTGPLGARRGREFEFDPGIEAIAPAYTSRAMAYFRETLGLDLDVPYQVLNREVNRGWNWSRGPEPGRGGYTSTSADLARALRRNPTLKVLAASGRYDLGTPYSASDWSLAQLDAPAEVMQRVQHRYYDAGHMMYTRAADLRQLAEDLGDWLRD